MAGRIRREDVDEVRNRARIDDVISDYVTLRPAGVGSLKGLCPFHDERSPSFNVRPQVGRYHCFGCGEGGDVFDFLQAVDHLSFTEAVERLAAVTGVQLRYEEGPGPDRAAAGRRQRLLDANAAAEVWFREQLFTPEARAGQEFLAERHFSREQAETFGVGYAPRSWDQLLRHLRGRGFTDDELTTAGLASAGQRGPVDRFRGRLMWPIRDVTGATVGFGARKLAEDDNGPKYLNTPQTPVYNKSAVLYGLDLAKRDIAKQRQAVVVEGYTDVMAMHLSGVGTALATCGTAFGAEHIKLLRRLIVDDDSRTSRIVFTFDGDEAGRKAALRAFEEDQRFVAQTYVAVESTGRDPCELWVQDGPDAVRALVETREPMFEFAIRATLAGLDLDRAEDRVQGLRMAAPVVAGIRDEALRPQYVRWLAGRIGMDPAVVDRAVAGARRGGAPTQARRQPPRREQAEPAPAQPVVAEPDLRDPQVRVERQLLQMLLQFPEHVPADVYESLGEGALQTPAYRALDDGIRALGGPAAATGDWLTRLAETVPLAVRPMLSALAVAPLPERRVEHLAALAGGLLRQVRVRQLERRRADVYSRLQRAESAGDTETIKAMSSELMELHRAEHALRNGQ